MGIYMKARWVLRAVVVSLFLLGMNGVADAASTTWDFTGSGGEGTIGNSRSFTVDGITITATAWSYNGTSFQQARLGQWSTGLGVCSVVETCGNPVHQVDNQGQGEYVLFSFSSLVDPSTVRIDPYGTYDTDVSYWAGTVSSLNLTGTSYAGLAGLGFGSRIDNDGPTQSSFRDVSIVSPAVTALLFGAKYQGGGNDYFKITSMTGSTPVPEPSSLLLLGLGIGGLAWLQTKRRANV